MAGYQYPDVVYQPQGQGNIKGGHAVVGSPLGGYPYIYSNYLTPPNSGNNNAFENNIEIPSSSVYQKYNNRFDQRNYYTA